MQHSKEEIFHPGQDYGCTVAAYETPADVVNSRQMKARGAFIEIKHPEAGKLKYPSLPFHLSEATPTVRRAAPLLGEHNEEIYDKWLGYGVEELVRLRAAAII